jgi:hypothetical protein
MQDLPRITESRDEIVHSLVDQDKKLMFISLYITPASGHYLEPVTAHFTPSLPHFPYCEKIQVGL